MNQVLVATAGALRRLNFLAMLLGPTVAEMARRLLDFIAAHWHLTRRREARHIQKHDR
jgi:hypothetical protein